MLVHEFQAKWRNAETDTVASFGGRWYAAHRHVVCMRREVYVGRSD